MVGSTYDGCAGGQSTPGPPVVHGPRSSSEKHNEPKGRTPLMNTLIAATDPSQNIFQQVIDATIPIGQYELHWLELIGVTIGIASAWLGMKRLVWAWPVGIVANIMLFFVYVGGRLRCRRAHPPVRPVRPAGLLHHRQHLRLGPVGAAPARHGRRQRRPGDRAALDAPRGERSALVVVWLVGTVIVHQAFVALWDARRTRSSRRSGGSTGATRGSSSARSSRPTPWRAAGTSSGWPGSASTSSASRSASPPATCRPR